MKKDINKIKLLKRGFLRRCPKCGTSPIFSGYIKPFDQCKNCGINFSKYRSDDGPAYCTIFIVGHVVVPIILIIEKHFSPSIKLQMIFWPIVTLLLTLWLLPKIKGAFIALQIFLKDNQS